MLLLVLLLAMVWCFGSPAVQAADRFVATTGLDSNSGLSGSPWKTFSKAAAAAVAGEIVTFEDGTYNETVVSNVVNSGTLGSPITFKARNKHQAKIIWASSFANLEKFQSFDKNYIIVDGFDMTQVTRDNPASLSLQGTFIQLWNCTGCQIRNNTVHFSGSACMRAGQDGGSAFNNVVFDGNICWDMALWNIVSFATLNMEISNNELHTFADEGIYTKGNAKGTKIFNNYVHGDGTGGIILGGASGAAFVGDSSVTGYECYNCVAYNNIIVAPTAGGLDDGLTFRGCKDCAAYNNVVINAVRGLRTRANNGPADGWAWTVTNLNPNIRNNIFLNCSTSAADLQSNAGTVTIDYNLFQGCSSPPSQTNPRTGNPLFVNNASDWHLQAGSPAIDTGVTLTFTGHASEVVPVNIDRDGVTRSGTWELGAYEFAVSAPATPIVLRLVR